MVLGFLFGCSKDIEQPTPGQQASEGNDLDASITAAATDDMPLDEVNNEVTDLEEDLSGW